MKAYTDIEQSKKLAEFLPLESADMHYNDWSYDFLEGYEHTGRYKADLGTPKTICGELDIPCWSLAALLGVYPMLVGRDLDMFCCWQNSKNLHSRHYDNAVDACVEMILKLHERNLL